MLTPEGGLNSIRHEVSGAFVKTRLHLCAEASLPTAYKRQGLSVCDV